MSIRNNNGHAVTDVLPPNSDQSQVAPADVTPQQAPPNTNANGVKNPRLKGPKT